MALIDNLGVIISSDVEINICETNKMDQSQERNSHCLAQECISQRKMVLVYL